MLKRMFSKQPKAGKRDANAINQEYAQLCAQLGENSFRQIEMEKVNTRIASRIREIGQEMESLKLQEAKQQVKAKEDQLAVAPDNAQAEATSNE